MSVIGTVREFLDQSNRSIDRAKPESEGAYWCDDCGVRIRDVDVEGDTPPSCPECAEEMRFERSPDSSSCAC